MNPSPRHAPATARNRAPILEALRPLLPPSGLLLEVASGTGEHAAWMAPRLSETLIWQPTEADPSLLSDIDAHAAASGARNLRPALLLDVARRPWPVDRADALLCCNMLHIAPWQAAEALFAGAAAILPASAAMVLYGPYVRDGVSTAPSNLAFHHTLKQQDERWGLRSLEREVVPLARQTGFDLQSAIALPANNVILHFERQAAVKDG